MGMDAYCHKHHTNNCIECAIEKQTKAIVEAIKGLRPVSVSKPAPLRCRVFGHKLITTEPGRGVAGAMACLRCPYKSPGIVWPRPE